MQFMTVRLHFDNPPAVQELSHIREVKCTAWGALELTTIGNLVHTIRPEDRQPVRMETSFERA